MVIKTVVILTSYAASFYFMLFGTASIQWRLLASLSMGFFAAQFGMSIQHDANHGKHNRTGENYT